MEQELLQEQGNEIETKIIKQKETVNVIIAEVAVKDNNLMFSFSYQSY